MRTYEYKYCCDSANEAEMIRERLHNKIWSELSAKEVVKELRTAVMFDAMRFECIVKVEVI